MYLTPILLVLLSLTIVDSEHKAITANTTEIPDHTNNADFLLSDSPVDLPSGPQRFSSAIPSRDKRGTPSSFELDQNEIARQNQITQQIFANYLERRLFPNRTASQKIPTIAEILPQTTTPKGLPQAKPRRYSSSSSSIRNQLRGSGNSSNSGNRFDQQRHKPGRFKERFKTKGTHKNRNYAVVGHRGRDHDNDEDEDVNEQQTLFGKQKPIDQDDDDDDNDNIDEVYDGQESLQSVESEQHDHYYRDVFNRDPSENEVDSVADCPNCVDEPQFGNKWTMPLLKLGEKRYYLGIFFKANWFKASQYCRYHGMHLASIGSQEENDRLEKHIRDFGLGNEHFWISGTDLADEGTFFWMASGRPITFTNWNAGEPNNFRYENGEEENCLELWNRDGKGLKWNDSPCSFETFFVCEVQPN